MTDTPPTKPEDVIKRYFMALQNPEALLDKERIQGLEDKLGSATDHVERLMIRAELRDAKMPPADDMEGAFIEVAKDWAAENNVLAEDFVAEGVPAEVVRKARVPGYRATERKRASSSSGSSSSSSSSERQTRTSREEMNRAINILIGEGKRFTYEDIKAICGCSTSAAARAMSDTDWPVERIAQQPATFQARQA